MSNKNKDMIDISNRFMKAYLEEDISARKLSERLDVNQGYISTYITENKNKFDEKLYTDFKKKCQWRKNNIPGSKEFFRYNNKFSMKKLLDELDGIKVIGRNELIDTVLKFKGCRLSTLQIVDELKNRGINVI